MSGKFYNFPVCFREAAFVCFMSSDSHRVRRGHCWDIISCSLPTSHEPSRGAGEWRKLFVKFSEYFPRLLFSEKCWPLVSRSRGWSWLSVRSLYPGRLIMTGLRGCHLRLTIITPKLEHGRPPAGLARASQTQFWENNFWSQCISCESLEYLNSPLGQVRQDPALVSIWDSFTWRVE